MKPVPIAEIVMYALLNGVSVAEAKDVLSKKPPHTLIRDRVFPS